MVGKGPISPIKDFVDQQLKGSVLTTQQTDPFHQISALRGWSKGFGCKADEFERMESYLWVRWSEREFIQRGRRTLFTSL